MCGVAAEEPYVEAARALGAPTAIVLARHVLPNALAPLVVQGTFVCASVILAEAIPSFLGVGISPETPTWGNIMAEGRALFRILSSTLGCASRSDSRYRDGGADCHCATFSSICRA